MSCPVIRHHPRRAVAFAALAWVATALLAASAAGAESVYRASPDNYRRAIGLLRPGDTLALSAGEYRDGLPVRNLSGEPGRPITISGPRRGAPATFVARDGRNTVSIVDSRYVVIRNLVLEGDNLPVDAVKAEGHVALGARHHAGKPRHSRPRQQSADRRHLDQVPGLELGDPRQHDHRGRHRNVSGQLRRQRAVRRRADRAQPDRRHYRLQPADQASAARAPTFLACRSDEARRSSATTCLRSRTAARPESARPNVLVGHFPLEGPGAEDDYAIYGNFFYQNRHEALFQGEGNVALYSNLFVNAHGDAIRIQPHNDIPRRILIAYNTVVAAGAGISLLQKEGAPAVPAARDRERRVRGCPPSRAARRSTTSRRRCPRPVPSSNGLLRRLASSISSRGADGRERDRPKRVRRNRSRTGRRISMGESACPGPSAPTAAAERTRDGFRGST